MKTKLERGLVLGLAACVAATSLAGCGKNKELDTAKAVATLDGEEISVGLVNCLLRYQQAQFETYYGSWLKSYYGDDIWSADLTGSGTAYGDTFKDEVMTSLERMLLAEKHMADYGVEITEEDKEAIAAAAAEFVAANGEDVLKEMSATTENVERMLTLYTIEHEMEHAMGEDVDTEVSDEEAAQRTVSYVRFDVKSEEETEAAAEADTESTETEAVAEAAETEKETEPAETSSEAAVTEAEAVKTESADETESEAQESSEAETAAETETEAASEDAAEVETEAETEDEETRAAKAEAKARAEAFLETAKTADDFAAAAAEVTENDADASTSSYTFGDDDTYPDAAIIAATKDLEDNTLVEEVIEVNDSYYVLYVDDAFDEDAVANKKEEIIATRKQEAVDALYEEWMDAAEFTVDEEVFDKLIFDIALTIESEADTEEITEADTEEAAEASTETASEVSETEAVSEAETEASTEAVETETEAETAAETEAATESAE